MHHFLMMSFFSGKCYMALKKVCTNPRNPFTVPNNIHARHDSVPGSAGDFFFLPDAPVATGNLVFARTAIILFLHHHISLGNCCTI